MSNVIEIKHLTKNFGALRAVDDLSFEVREGELFAFLGVNGAGKSTTISIICGQLLPDAGSIRIGGVEVSSAPDEVKKKIGIVFQGSVLDGALSVRANLESRAALYGMCRAKTTARICELAELLDFKDLLSRPVGKLSGGQRRRIDIARALLHSPEILILDEPTTGLDPQTRSMLWSVITRLRHEKGMTVLLTTHYMEEAADADYVVIIESGRLAAKGTPHELKARYASDYLTVYGRDADAVSALGYPTEQIRDGVRISLPSTEVAKELICEHPELFCDFELVKGKMDDVFLRVTGKALEGEVES